MPDGHALVSTGGDGTLRVWDLAGAVPREQRVFQVGPESLVAQALSPDGQTLAAGNFNMSAVYLLGPTTGKVLHTLSPVGANLRDLAFSPDGRTLATAASSLLKLWDVQTGKERHTLKGEDGIGALAFSPDGKVLASGGMSNVVRLWDPATGREIGKLDGLPMTNGTAISPDGKWLAALRLDQHGILWDLASRQKVRDLPAAKLGHSVVFSPNGRLLAVTSGDSVLRLLDPSSGNVQREFKVGMHLDPYISWRPSFAPDGRHLITANPNGTVYIFRLAPAK
jgi:WD40 repeat protein